MTPKPPEKPNAVSMNPPNVSLAVPPGLIPIGDSTGIAPISNHSQLMKLRQSENMTMTMQKYRHWWNNVFRFIVSSSVSEPPHEYPADDEHDWYECSCCDMRPGEEPYPYVNKLEDHPDNYEDERQLFFTTIEQADDHY